MTAKDFEQLVYVRARAAFAAHQSGRKSDEEAREDIDKSIHEVVWLLETGRSTERISILASAHKRRAMIGSEDDVERDLAQMIRHYEEAAAAKGDEAYPRLNGLLGVLLLGGPSDGHQDCGSIGSIDEFNSVLQSVREELEQLEAAGSPRDFWEAVRRPDFEFVDSIRREALGDEWGDLAKRYEGVFSNWGSPREKSSVLDQLRFVVAIASHRGMPHLLEPTERLLKKLEAS